ncbi:pseudaminic acid cytidylyltransferase [bacterium]|nr:pseudaminic acid cytidylyltransferase [bacterium]
MESKIICIIPARSGSKRILNKNIKLFCGKPLISYVIKNAFKSKLFDKIIVSTDSQKISKIAINYGAETPFIRPKSISNSKASTLSVIKHTINKLRLNDNDIICCMYPTSPLLNISYIKKSLLLLNNNINKIIFTIMEFDNRFQRGFYINKNTINKFYSKNNIKKNSQDLTKLFVDAGQIYFGTVKKYKKLTNLIDKNNLFVIIKKDSVVDIDNISDWDYAEYMFKKLNK